jgi:hypothetical protein
MFAYDDVPTTPPPLPPREYPPPAPRLRRTNPIASNHFDDSALEILQSHIKHAITEIESIIAKNKIKRDKRNEAEIIYDYIIDPVESAQHDKIKELTILISRIKSFSSESNKVMFADNKQISDIIMELEDYLPSIEKAVTDANRSIMTGIAPITRSGFDEGYYKKYMKYKLKYHKLKNIINEKRKKS